MLKSILTALIFLVYCNAGFTQDIKLLLPLHGEQGKDFWINNYVDHGTNGDIRDAFCGGKTYAGHQGTDFSLLSFKTMDGGVYIYAMADGIVTETTDGFYDRNMRRVIEAPDNHIVIFSGNKYYITYGHMMKNSQLVHKGDTVKAGQPIGKVGSSGASAYPQVSIEIRLAKQYFIDPFSGGCQTVTPSLWAVQPAYDTAIYAKDIGFVGYSAGFDSLAERSGVRDTFNTKRDKVIYFWAQMHAPARDYKAHVEWYSPDGKLWQVNNWLWENKSWNSYGTCFINMPMQTGTWLIKYYFNDEFVSSKNFYVVSGK